MARQPQPATSPAAVSGGDLVGLTYRLRLLVRQGFGTRMAQERWAQDTRMRPGCFAVLRTVAAADGTRSQREVSEETGIDPSDVVDLVDRLEHAGFLRRRRDDRDRRRYALELTAGGRRALRRFGSVSDAVGDELFAVLDEDERAALAGLLQRVVDAPRLVDASLPLPRG